MTMQRDGNSEDRAKAGASGRTPPVIEGEATEVVATGAHEPAAAESHDRVAEPVSDASDQAPPADEAERDESAQTENGGPADAMAAPPPRKSRRGVLIAVLGLLIVAIAGAVAWVAAPGQRSAVENDLKARVVALLPESAQRALHLKPAAAPAAERPATPAPSQASQGDAGKTDAGKSDQSKVEPVKTEPAKTETAKSEPGAPAAITAEPARPETPQAEPEKAAAAAPKSAEPAAEKSAASGEARDSGAPAAGASTSAAQAPAGDAPSGSMTIVGNPPVAIGVDPKRIEDMSVKIDGLQAKVEGLQGKLDAALGRIEDLQSKLELAQGKLAGAASADAVTQATQKLETATQRLAAIEQKLEQPKTDARAPQSRENNAPSGREFAASRAVVAQATTEALRAGAPLGDNLAALKGLGVADEKIADLAPYAKAGAPTVAQLAQQWRGLRDKVVALDAPPPGASFSDKLIAKAKSVFRVTWAGQGQKNSIGATAARIDAALQKSDLAAALVACDDFPAVAKNVVVDWQKAAAARLKADAAVRTLLSESISAIGRSSSQ